MPLGFRPTDDPEWRHVHVAQGRERQCARPGCKVTWEVYCHSGNRRYCPVCARAVRRVRDREDKARIRKRVKRNVAVYKAQGQVMQTRSRRAIGRADISRAEIRRLNGLG